MAAEKDEVQKAQSVLRRKRKNYALDMMPLSELKKTKRFADAMEKVKMKFGGTLADGTKLFDYQLECAAFIVAKKRLLNSMDMGLGKTRTTIAGVASDDANKKILIITMSRNLNDWERELKNMGFEEEYIVLQNPKDLHSPKKFHLVSYERWSKEYGRPVFRRKQHVECPHCTFAGLFKMNLQYCTVCKRKAEPMEERWSEKDMPKECPGCGESWKNGQHICQNEITNWVSRGEKRVCGYSIIESKKPALYEYYHNGYDAAVVDEGHYIKNGDTQRALAVRRVKTRTKVLLSGTPAENGTEDLYWVIGWLTGFSSRFDNPYMEHDPKPFQGYGKLGYDHFREYYGGGKKRAVLDIDSVSARISNHEKLWKVLDSIMYRKRKLDADVQAHIAVPKPEHHRYHVEMLPAERELYDQTVREFSDWYELEQAKKEAAAARGEVYRINTITICGWMHKLQKAASCPWVFDTYDAAKGIKTAKMLYLEKQAADLLRRNKKIIVFSGHKETVEYLKLVLDNLVYGKRAEFIHGGVKKEDRWKLIEEFQDPNNPLSILILSHRTGAESYTLTEAKAVFLFDLDFNGKRIEQCYSRAVRLSQKDVVDIHWMLNVGSIDINMHALCLSKVSGVNMAIDREELNFEEIAEEFEGDSLASAAKSMDMEQFAREMLQSGTKRNQIA
ncbi:SNF2 family DNA or RNA helicase/DNA-directed RNA polymerase subunit RPC12/RpoP [Paenibacillus mucilaginosus]|uniref:DEAD/DEAH box helicase n=1 Tax=Paenibacillus mucilaginosus TaxID=61624 RepID=UPI003D1F7233